MKHYTDIELGHIFEQIKQGVPFVGVRNNSMVGGVILLHPHSTSYINYERHGSSTIRANKKNLRWLLETIFDDADEVVRATHSEYHICFVPEDERYERIDYSTKHPNVFGK